MEDGYPLDKENPRDKANVFSKSCFLWMKPMCQLGAQRQLELRDLFKIRNQDKSASHGDRLQDYWDMELKKKKLWNSKPSLIKALLKAYIWRYLAYGLLAFTNIAVLRAVQPLALGALIKCFTSENYNLEDILLYGGGLALLTLSSTFLMHHTSCGTNLIGMRMRVAVSSLIYRKTLRLSQTSLFENVGGSVINLLSNDVARFDLIVIALNYIWIAPLHIIIVAYLLWTQIGASSLIGIFSMMILTVPLQLFLGSVTSKYRLAVAKKTDHRVRVMSELLAGIQVIKMYAWEKPFEYVVELARKEEVARLKKSSNIRAVFTSFKCIVERGTLAITVVCYFLMGNEITAEIVFPIALYFNGLQLSLAIMFPLTIAFGAETLVSIRRIQAFLMLPEKEPVKTMPSEDNSILLRQVEACWVPRAPILNNLNITIPAGKLCAVVGPVGSGKSSLLKLLLGEMSSYSGTIKLSGEISYASQEPWLFHSDVRNNILFGQSYDRLHYKEVVQVCALEKDFDQFPEGDRTRVGDRGVSLSGGQRARINLARAVYREADIYLLDDPLSAVDSEVGRHLFDKCIIDYLRDKTRILVTHQLHYLRKADLIVVLNKGKIEAQGTYQDLLTSKTDFTKMLQQTEEIVVPPKELNRMLSIVSTITTVSSFGDATEEYSEDKSNEEVVNFQGSALWCYIKSCRGLSTKILLLVLFALSQICLSGTDYWITYWTNQVNIRNPSYEVYTNSSTSTRTLQTENFLSDTMDKLHSIFEDFLHEITETVSLHGEQYTLLKMNVLMYIYIILCVSAAVFSFARSFLFFYTCMGGSKKLHKKMFHCLLQTPMRFFDTNPSGRILNRFSKDMGTIDEDLPRALMDVLQILSIVSGIILMVVLPNPYMLIILVILGFIFMMVRNWYVKTAKSVKHIESIAKSPVFSFISSTIDGVTTIRSAKTEAILTKQFDDHQDVHSSAWYIMIFCSDTFGLWLDLICVTFVCCVIAGFVILDQYTSIGGSFAGLAISQSLNLVGMLQFGMFQIAQAINYLISVERVLEYTQLEKEFPLETAKEKKPIEPWPSKGNVNFENVSLSYTPTDPPVLNNLNFEIKPTEKVGIVGRTGAGKSSLIAALFRLAPIEGKILIDSVDTKSLGLRDLRKKISIIPQEPVLFSGTIRYNLDPFGEFKDEKLWNVLEEVELKTQITSLDFMITEGGGNFSVGQRQLICLARAILRDNTILILDEATANVDPKTDSLIQETIRRKFKNCTVLTIAHRLNTIMDSDKVLVMDHGRLMEFDHPHILLQDTNGYFNKLVSETGVNMTQNLKEIAQKSYQSKYE